MQFYGLSDRQVLEMPINRFWLLFNTSFRIEAHNDLRALQIAIVTAGMGPSGEGIEQLQTLLSSRLGVTVTDGGDGLESQGDPDAIDKLRRLAALQ